VSGSGISWAICKSAPRSRQITMPASHHSVFYRPDALLAAQPTASKQWRQWLQHYNWTTTLQPFYSSGFCPGLPGSAGTRRNILYSLTSWLSITPISLLHQAYPQHLPCSCYRVGPSQWRLTNCYFILLSMLPHSIKRQPLCNECKSVNRTLS